MMNNFMTQGSPCVVCHINTMDIDQLERLCRELRHKVDTEQVHSPTRHMWQFPIHCSYGIGNCQDINRARNTFNRLTEELDYLLAGYIEQTDCSDYYNILRYLQGTYPNVYRDFEIAIHKKNHD